MKADNTPRAVRIDLFFNRNYFDWTWMWVREREREQNFWFAHTDIEEEEEEELGIKFKSWWEREKVSQKVSGEDKKIDDQKKCWPNSKDTKWEECSNKNQSLIDWLTEINYTHWLRRWSDKFTQIVCQKIVVAMNQNSRKMFMFMRMEIWATTSGGKRRWRMEGGRSGSSIRGAKDGLVLKRVSWLKWNQPDIDWNEEKKWKWNLIDWFILIKNKQLQLIEKPF